MTLFFIRGFFFLICGVVGYFVGDALQTPLLGIQIGLLSGLVLIFIEQGLHRVYIRGLSSVVFGLLLGVFMAKILSDIMLLLPLGNFIQSVSRVVLTVLFSYFGAVMALRSKDEFNIIIPYVRFRRQNAKEEKILLDTSAIIDGRIVNVCHLNFLPGCIIVPRFVLLELQRLADSSDDLKRQRGRRGMELLRKMQNDKTIDLRIHEEDVLEEKDVDQKLVMLGKLMDVRICTTDYNLGRVASLQGVDVINIQEVANALKMRISEGQELKVKLIREGKEPDQAVAYCDDGTMIVVGEAKDRIGENVDICVTSILQTQSGRIIFAKLI